MTKTIFHLEDSQKWIENVTEALAGLDVDLVSASDKHDFYMKPYETASLCILDRHFPSKRGGLPEENWEDIAGYLQKHHPNIPLIILSDQPPSRKICSHYKNIRGVLHKGQFSDEVFRSRVKIELGVA